MAHAWRCTLYPIVEALIRYCEMPGSLSDLPCGIFMEPLAGKLYTSLYFLFVAVVSIARHGCGIITCGCDGGPGDCNISRPELGLVPGEAVHSLLHREFY